VPLRVEDIRQNGAAMKRISLPVDALDKIGVADQAVFLTDISV